MSHRLQTMWITLSSVVLVLFGATVGLVAAGVRLNLTASVPLGFYLESSRGHLVEFCPAEPYAIVSLERGYRSRGVCQDGGTPLLKPVVARGGDVVEVSASGLRVNGVAIPHTMARTHDSDGRSLQAYPHGQYVVQPHQVWVAISEPRSFDSRYYGPVDTGAIRGYLRPLWTW